MRSSRASPPSCARPTAPSRPTRVVVAAGPWTGGLLEPLGMTLPLAPAIAQVTFLDAPRWSTGRGSRMAGAGRGRRLRPSGARRGLQARLRRRRRRLGPATSRSGRPTAAEEARILDWIERHMARRAAQGRLQPAASLDADAGLRLRDRPVRLGGAGLRLLGARVQVRAGARAAGGRRRRGRTPRDLLFRLDRPGLPGRSRRRRRSPARSSAAPVLQAAARGRTRAASGRSQPAPRRREPPVTSEEQP